MADAFLPPLTKRVRVPRPLAETFRLFTDEMAAWWPLATHSVGREDAVDVRVEGRVGGRIIETTKDGTSHTWGTLTDWSPPERLAFTWHPGYDEAAATHVDVTLAAAQDGTDLTLVHSKWPDPDGTETRAMYDTGWDYVLSGLWAG
jgi:uncharacterized protein YndB with AHSA1/START domain